MASRGCASQAHEKGPGCKSRPLVVYNAAVLRGQWSGVEKSVCEFARALAFYPGRPFDFKILLPGGVSADSFPEDSVVRLPSRARGRLGRILYELFEMPSLARRLKADLFISPAYVTPPHLPCPSLLVVYDLHVYTHPRFCKRLNILHYRLRMGSSIRSAAAIAVPTDHVRKALVSLFPGVVEKTAIVPLGVSEDYFGSMEEEERIRFRRKYHLPRRYLAMAGAFSPRKNLAGALEAWRLLRGEAPDLGLVIVGKGRGAACLPDGVVSLGYLAEEEMPMLYGCAEALVYPSFDEGFGLPVAEAMACGCPVVTSPVPAREFADGAAVFCDVHSPASIAASVREVVSGPWGVAEGRSARIAAGRKQAEALRWSHAAERMVSSACRALGMDKKKAPSR